MYHGAFIKVGVLVQCLKDIYFNENNRSQSLDTNTFAVQ